MDFEIKIQLLAFIIGTLTSFFLVRPFMLRFAHRNGSVGFKTNAEALVGKHGRVIVEINYAKNEGRAIIEGDDWKVVSENNEIIPEGANIEVLRVNSTILVVKQISKS